MSRSIKFRVWDKNRKYWIFFGVIKELVDAIWDNDSLEFAIKFDPKNSVVQQFTGLTDKNNKEIFEGDILCLPGNFNPEAGDGNVIVLVEWLGAGWIYRDIFTNQIESVWGLLGNHADQDIEVTIIGNIFENPELIFKK